MPSVILKKGRDHRLHAGHCWVYAGEIDKLTGDPKDGDAVDIRDYKDRFLGRGLLNTNSQITVRRFTTQKEEIDKAFFARRIEAALEYRRENTSIGDASAFRVVCSEGDMLPGLIVDRYGDHIVFQALTLGIDQRKPQILEILREMFEPNAIVERSDVPSRKLEGLGGNQRRALWRRPRPSSACSSTTFPLRSTCSKTRRPGFFLDQRDNYAEVARLCAGKRVLDCFSYHGGFALAAGVADAKSVEAVEISEQAVARARKNAELNGLTGKIEFVCANAFDVLKKYDSEKHQYDVIVLDPPTFTRTKQNVEGALRGYKEINLRALKMLRPAAFSPRSRARTTSTRSCSNRSWSKPPPTRRRTLRLVKVLTQSPDHPILPAVPETEYLRGLLLQVM